MHMKMIFTGLQSEVVSIFLSVVILTPLLRRQKCKSVQCNEVSRMINRTIRSHLRDRNLVISLDNDTGSLARGCSCIIRIALNGINPFAGTE